MLSNQSLCIFSKRNYSSIMKVHFFKFLIINLNHKFLCICVCERERESERDTDRQRALRGYSSSRMEVLGKPKPKRSQKSNWAGQQQIRQGKGNSTDYGTCPAAANLVQSTGNDSWVESGLSPEHCCSVPPKIKTNKEHCNSLWRWKLVTTYLKRKYLAYMRESKINIT